jgi:N-acetylneuraminate lyase
MAAFLEKGSERIPNLSGLKYTSQDTFMEFKCIRLQEGRFDILHGHDETYFLGLAMGAKSGIGTSLNVCAPLFGKIVEAFEAGDLAGAADWQVRANQVIDLMCRYNIIATTKELLTSMGVKAGPPRLPNGSLTSAQKADLKAGFFDLYPFA